MVLRRVLVSGPITALVAASPRWKVTIFGSRTSGPCGGGRKEGPQGHKGSVTPLRKRGTIISPLVLTLAFPLCTGFVCVSSVQWVSGF